MAVVNNADQLQQRVAFLRTDRQQHEDTMQEISDLFMPFRGDINTRHSRGQRRKPLFDSWGAMMSDRFTNFLNGSLYPSSSDWVRLRAAGVLEFDHTVETALDDTSMRIMEALAASNFYVSSHTDTRDWGVLGNSTLYTQHDNENAVGDGFGGLIFDPIPWSRMWWTFSHIGRPLIVVRAN